MAGTKVEHDAIYGVFAGTIAQNDTIYGVFAGTKFENEGTYQHSVGNLKMENFKFFCRQIKLCLFLFPFY